MSQHFISDIRPLSSDDCAAYRALRQRIYNSEDARFFSDSFERERALTDDQWRDWCAEKQEHCILGIFVDQALSGVLMITRQGDAGSPVVEWEAVWLDPLYRGKGLMQQAYERARAWSEDHGYCYVVEFIRDTFTPNRCLCEHRGFVFLYTITDELWADGSVGNTHTYILDLSAEADEHAHEPPMMRFNHAMTYLTQGPHAPTEQARVKVA